MIDSTHETLLTLKQAARTVPGRSGRHPHVATIYRWATRGVRGVILETLQVGGTKCTSREALQRFFEAITEPQGPRSFPRTAAQARREREIEEELDRLGI
jgi:hypothetical protein